MKNAEVSFTGFITTKITVPVSEHSTDPVGDAYREARRQLQRGHWYSLKLMIWIFLVFSMTEPTQCLNEEGEENNG